ncbi:uncharacterized protein [Typha latifolia]|uniref:uncharacterized protein isoform X1 n=1 Tax=Typha latifolia TaxID=4733 RepID=UPI003C30744B
MALAVCFRPHRCAPFASPSSPPRRGRRRLLFPKSTAMAAMSQGGGAAVVWFKNDLRIDDHPGLVAAVAEHSTVVPVYVFDPRILSGYSEVMLELLLFALGDLRKLLKSQGCELLIGLGNAEDIIFNIVNEVKASCIFAEEEVEYNLRKVITNVESSLSAAPFAWGGPEFVFWRTPFYDVKDLRKLPASYNDFQKLKLSTTTPLAAPTLPVLNMESERGALPTLAEVKRYLTENSSQLDESWIAIKDLSAKSILRKANVSQATTKLGSSGNLKNYGTNDAEISVTSGSMRRIKSVKSMFASEKASEVRGGNDIVLEALAAYLRYLEGTAKDDWQELHEKLRNAESTRGASFRALFGAALFLGAISRRRVYFEAIKYERERNAGFLSPFGYSTPTVTAAVDAVCSMEWYSLLALKSQVCNEGIYPIRVWRWNGYLVQYTAVGHEGPAVLLVHGFGAFLEHFRGNIADIADTGHRVWAITLLGFGKSEKPNVIYTELIWGELVRDFIVDVVGEPAHLVGNSIGGYIVSVVAGLWPSLVKSLVPINTAGSIVPSYSSVRLNEGSQLSGLSWFQARLLLLYLRSRAGKILKDCYPTKTERVDSWLINDIVRASYDPGAAAVLESILSFGLSIPLNFLFDSYGGEVLIIQGMRDPIRKSELFLSMIREHCSKVSVRELDAGHCPHDELPEEVNRLLSEWTSTIEVSPAMERS